MASNLSKYAIPTIILIIFFENSTTIMIVFNEYQDNFLQSIIFFFWKLKQFTFNIEILKCHVETI